MKVVISSGHGLYIRGASGSPVPPYLDEVDEARRVVNQAASDMRRLGVEVVTFHDDVSDDQSENLDRIIAFHNSQQRDLDVSVHFNSAEFNGSNHTSNPVGCEVFYKSDAGQAAAVKLVNAISDAGDFINRGPKYSSNLAFLNQTEMPAVLLEICFVNSTADAELYRQNFDLICDAIADAIAEEDEEAIPPDPSLPFPRPPKPPETIEPVPPATDRRVLGKGDSGPDVAVVQAVLGIPADGAFGSVTATQVEAFQRADGLAADGVVGPATWSSLDDLAARMMTGSARLPDGIATAVTLLAKASPLMFFSWPDRGRAPPGYIPGMALCYALALLELGLGRSWAEVMAADMIPGSEDTDVLAWYESELDQLGIEVDRPGVEALRGLFTIMIGLGMRESSGKYCEGRDMSASNIESDTCEAGLFQTSWNMESADESLSELLANYWDNPNGFLPTFALTINPTSGNLDVYGSGNGAAYQWLAKYSPAFAVMSTAVGLRKRRKHWGPINEKDVTLSRDAVTLLQTVEMIVAMAPTA